MLNYGLTKTTYLVHSGRIRSVKDGGNLYFGVVRARKTASHKIATGR